MHMPAKEMVEITEFAPQHQTAIEQLVLPIQQVEFGVVVTREEQPDLIDIEGVFKKGNGNFWLALRNEEVVGCVGVADIGNAQVALKKMFVHREFRGKQFGVGATLFDTAKQWCLQRGVKSIFLGTTPQMAAAHRFYEKNGFVEVEKPQLPPAFPIAHVDSKFYRCDLEG
jgi:N-acetylglutamate synthase-like GNAT family acetyltransferase